MSIHLSKIFLIYLFFYSFKALSYEFFITDESTIIGKIQFLNEASRQYEDKIVDIVESQIKNAKFPSTTNNPLSKVFQSDYYLGIDKRVQIRFSAIDFPEIYSDELAKDICQEIKCEFLYKGPELRDYIPSTKWQDVFKNINLEKNINFIYKDTQISFLNVQNNFLKQALVKTTLPDFIYFGLPGKILYYDPSLIEKIKLKEQKSGTYLVINGKTKQVMKELLRQKELKDLVESSNADCGFSGSKDSFYLCTTQKNSSKFLAPDDWPQEISLKYWNGDASLFFTDDYRDELSELIIRQAPPHIAFESKKLEIYFSNNSLAQIFHTHKSDYSLPALDQFKEVKIQYTDQQNLVGSIVFKDLDSATRKKIHGIILETSNANQFVVHEVKNGGEELIGRYEVKDYSPRDVTIKRAKRLPNLFIGLELEQRTMKATAPNSYSYFQRNERDDVSPTLNIEYWPEGRSWGLQLNGKEFTNQYSDSSGNEFKGRNREYLLSSEFRLIKFSPSFRYDLRFGFGGKIRYFLINTNTTLENYRLYSLPIKMELDIHWEDYILVGAFTFAPIFKISQDATTSNPWDKGFGLDKKFELKIKKNVSEKVRVSLGAMIELTDVSLDTEVLDINERGFMIGIEFPFRF